MISQPHLDYQTAHNPRLVRPLRQAVSVDGVTARRVGALVLSLGALLAFSPLHPGIVCPLRATTGIPCPTCGMTTSIKACLHLEFGAALAANPSGLVIVAATAGLVVMRPSEVKIPPALIFGAIGAMWVWQLVRFFAL